MTRFPASSVFTGLLLLSISFFTIGCSESPKGEGKLTGTITNSIGIEFVMIRPGSFSMGDATRQECDTCRADVDETPRHPVTISRPFYLSRTEVTQAQWLALMDGNPSRFKGDRHPVEYVSWNNVQLYIFALNHREKTEAYRLPTEAEWEYAARAGTEKSYPFGDEERKLPGYGWHSVNSGAKTRKVGKLAPNPWGLYDMHGNVLEWCQDWYGRDWYGKSPVTDPDGPRTGATKVRRGGFWGSHARACRVSARTHFPPAGRGGNTGFRLVKELP